MVYNFFRLPRLSQARSSEGQQRVHLGAIPNSTCRMTESSLGQSERKSFVISKKTLSCIIAGLGVGMISYDSVFPKTPTFRTMQRTLCEEYLSTAVHSDASDSRSLSPFASLPDPADPTQSGSMNRKLRSVSESDSTLLRRFLSCDQAFNSCTDSECPPNEAEGAEDAKFDRYPPADHPADDTPLPTGADNVAYVVTVQECPPHPSDVAASPDASVDSSNFYDGYAVNKAAVCSSSKEDDQAPGDGSSYTYTMYAIVHSSAVHCVGSDGTNFDLVKALVEMGYYVQVFDEAVYSGEMANSPYIAQNVDLKEMAAVHAYRLTNHPLVVLQDVTAMMMQPMDGLYNTLIADSNVKAAFTTDPTGLLDEGMLVIKPSLDEFQAIKDTFKNVAYDPSTGWGGSGIGAGGGKGAGLAGFLHYYYTNGNAALELERCTYNNGNDPACKMQSIENIKFARMSSICGKPWECSYDTSGWDAQTEVLCKDILTEWSRKRVDFEDNHWAKSNKVARTGSFQPDVFLGYCDGDGGKSGYKNMLNFDVLAPTPAAPEPTTTSTTTPAAPELTTTSTTTPAAPEPVVTEVPYIEVPAYLTVTCEGVTCPEGSYVKNDCTCTDPSEPCDACPDGTRCQNIEGYPLMCIDCTCGFCNYENAPCCDFNGVNNCKSTTNDNECNLQNGFFGPFGGSGSACSGVEISYTATPNGCGCQPSQTTPCIYDPNDRSLDDQCYICSADDIVDATEEGHSCWECKECLNNCNACVTAAMNMEAMEDCLSSQNMNKKNPNPECRASCSNVCGK